jgi:hypothetical protein
MEACHTYIWMTVGQLKLFFFLAFDNNIKFLYLYCGCGKLSCSPKVSLRPPQFSLGVQIQLGLLALDFRGSLEGCGMASVLLVYRGNGKSLLLQFVAGGSIIQNVLCGVTTYLNESTLIPKSPVFSNSSIHVGLETPGYLLVLGNGKHLSCKSYMGYCVTPGFIAKRTRREELLDLSGMMASPT